MLLRGWQDRLSRMDAVRRDQSQYYLSHLEVMRTAAQGDTGEARLLQPARLAVGLPLLRFPVVLRNANDKQRLLFDRGGVGLGVSGMYPGAVSSIPQIAPRLADTRFPRAEALARCLVTLPTHSLVTAVDRERICSLVNEMFRQHQQERIAS
jgi:dTDP-4-amino-4,6-dideoxygalactose transaminase